MLFFLVPFVLVKTVSNGSNNFVNRDGS